MKGLNMRNLKISVLLALSLVLGVSAATVKRPLTVKTYAKQYYLEWTGSAPVVTADDLELSADTTTGAIKGFDAFYLLYNKKVSIGEEKVYPGEFVPKRLCVAVTAGGDADGTTSYVYTTQSATAGGTYVRNSSAYDSLTTAGATKVTENVDRPIIPVGFIKVLVDPTTATDSVEVTAVRIWPCDGK
jgi:hypothetical protein